MEEYIVALYDLAENCNYGAMKEEMIRDCLVVGIQDSALSQKLQLDDKLTLETAHQFAKRKLYTNSNKLSKVQMAAHLIPVT